MYFVTSFISLIFWISFIYLILGLLLSRKKSHSSDYVELKTNLYITGMIDKFAEEDKIDLSEQLMKLREFVVLQKRNNIKTIDGLIKQRLMEKIERDTDNKLDKKKSKE